ncbi:MAG: hypothetical protein HOP18_09345 [Deltaproteobacteria bacterium]|nr:hypothetical protein [Deltaproteobacteria bacterium]
MYRRAVPVTSLEPRGVPSLSQATCGLRYAGKFASPGTPYGVPGLGNWQPG